MTTRKKKTEDSDLDKKVVTVYTWVSKAYYKDIKQFEVPEPFREAAKRIADENNGYRFDGTTLSWD